MTYVIWRLLAVLHYCYSLADIVFWPVAAWWRCCCCDSAYHRGWLLVIKDSEAGRHCVGDDRLWLTRSIKIRLCVQKVQMRKKALPTVIWYVEFMRCRWSLLTCLKPSKAACTCKIKWNKCCSKHFILFYCSIYFIVLPLQKQGIC